MADYPYRMQLVVDPDNPRNVVAAGSVEIYDSEDTTKTTLLALKDPSGVPIPNPITSNANGFTPPFVTTSPEVLWVSGPYADYFQSYKGMRDEAVGARQAAETAAAEAGAEAAVVAEAAIGTATDAATAAEAAAAAAASNAAASATAAANAAALVAAPADTAIAAVISNTNSAARGALNATILDQTFPVAVGVPKDTNPASIPVLRAAGDGKTARWEYIHNGGGGYLWHLLAGAGSTNGSWMFGIGLDSGAGGGAIFRNKAAGIGLKVEQLTSISATNAYGIAIEQRSQAPAIFGEMFTEATAALSSLVSYKSNSATLPLAMWQGANTKGGRVLAATGVLEWDTDVSVRNAPLRLKGDPTAPQDNQIMGRNGNIQFASYTGSTDQYWHKRIRHGGQSLFLELSGTTSGGPDGAVSTWYKAVEALQNGAETRLGFYGATPVAKPVLTYSRTGETAQAAALRTALASLGLVTDSTVA